MFGGEGKFKWSFGLIIAFLAIIFASSTINSLSNGKQVQWDPSSFFNISIKITGSTAEWNPLYQWEINSNAENDTSHGTLYVNLWGSVSEGLSKIKQRIFRYLFINLISPLS